MVSELLKQRLIINLRKQKQSHVHINTICNGERLQLKTPSYFVYYNRREHVTISVQYSSQVLSTVSKSYTQTSSVLNKSQVQNSSTNCLPLLRNPSWFNERSKFESHWLQLRNHHWQSPPMLVQISCTTVVATNSKLTLSSTSSTGLH